MDWFLPFLNGALLLVVGGAVTTLAQWAVPRIRKTREMALTAKTTAETAKTKVEEVAGWFEFYKEQIEFCQREIKGLRAEVAELRGEVHDWKTAVAEEAPADVRERIENNVRQKAGRRHKLEG